MLFYAAVLFVTAGIAAVFGFSDVAVGATGIARVLCAAMLACGVIALLIGGFGRKDT